MKLASVVLSAALLLSPIPAVAQMGGTDIAVPDQPNAIQIGRASCRERV